MKFLAALLMTMLLVACGGGDDSVSGSTSSNPVKTGAAQITNPGANFTGNGWYWDDTAGGTGMAFEAQGSSGFAGLFMYDGSGKPIWYVSSGTFSTSQTGYQFTGDLRQYSGGQSLGSAWKSPTSVSVGTLNIAFTGSGKTTKAVVSLPGGRQWNTVRFNFNGIDTANTSTQPESGWFWNAAEGGRGYAIEVQNGQMFMAMFHYAADGSPIWQVVQNNIDSSGKIASAAFQKYTNGQTLTSGWVPPQGPTPDGSISANFGSSCAGSLTIQGYAAISLQKFSFGGLPSGTECRSGNTNGGVANTDSQGYWTGVSPAGYTVNTAVLENGEVWGIYSAGSTIYGALYGTSSVSGSTFTVTGTDFNFLSNTSAPGTLTGPVVAKSTLTLSSTTGSVPLTYVASYDTPATAAAIAGTWSFTGRSGSYTLIPATITISNAGAFTLVQPGCTSNGSVVPRPGGKNIYNISLTTTGTACAVGQSSLSGVLNVDATITPNRFLSLVLTPSKNDGLIVIGTKQNTAPVAVAGPNQTVYVGTVVNLNGSDSYDPNGDPLTYSWTGVRPANSTASFSNSTFAATSFTADVAGTYALSLVVNDGKVNSATSTVTVTAIAPPISATAYYLYSRESTPVYLGCLNCGNFNTESVCNQFGTYGSEFASRSIWNQFGTYGSQFSSYSPWNQFSSNSPAIYGSDNLFYGYFTVNQFQSNSTNIQIYRNVLTFYSNTSNLSSTRVYMCGA